ncbi:MAG: tRNA pseudouridine55 synthase [Alphaproteobacteria bacterium]|jgi:tRNA pseudouridine55 synthase
MARKKGNHVHGFINFYKPVGMSSNQAVGFVRHIFDAKKAGHGGTLDPLAEGILPIALGEATKMLSYMLTEDKYYQFEMTFGTETETDDAEGAPVHTSDLRPTEKALRAVMDSFLGEITQTPPVYSALKIDGKRACDRVRAGEEVVLASRQVTIHSINLDEFDANKATLSVHVSKGTYIRSLTKDIGRQLGCYAYVTRLIRTEVPPFKLNDAITKEMLDLCAEIGQSPATHLLDVDHILADIPVYTASDNEVQTLLTGISIDIKREKLEGQHKANKPVRVKTEKGSMISLAEFDGQTLKPKKNFPLLNDIVNKEI